MADDDVPERLRDHLRLWLGSWPSRFDGVTVVGWPGRLSPGWDDVLRPVAGVLVPGGGVLSVPPEYATAVVAIVARASDVDTLLARIPKAVGLPDRKVYRATYRWSTAPAHLPDAGEWEPADARDLP